MKKILMPLAVSATIALVSSPVVASTIYCQLENGKQVSVRNLTTSPVYTYGDGYGKPELELPTGAPNSTVYKGSEMYAGGGAGFIAFTNGNYTYAVFDGIGRGWEFLGLKVYKGSELIMERQCEDGWRTHHDISIVNAPEGELP